MQTRTKTWAALALGATAALLGAVPAAASTTAAAPYGDQCGSGYGVVNRFDLPNARGTVYLTYHSGNGTNCVVTIRSNPGTATLMEAFLRKSGSSAWTSDSGNFTTYAGPVRVAAAGQCVDWGGTIGTATDFRYGTNCG
ncbi:spore-associated protein A [Saccharopolyspora sp. NPDC047091]|uniref:spore-associated protein A n=1 Tax=Saccharopolyspora sp. NPDC047091 TaxID=3155924 RepID=UPI0033EFE193